MRVRFSPYVLDPEVVSYFVGTTSYICHPRRSIC